MAKIAIARTKLPAEPRRMSISLPTVANTITATPSGCQPKFLFSICTLHGAPQICGTMNGVCMDMMPTERAQSRHPTATWGTTRFPDQFFKSGSAHEPDHRPKPHESSKMALPIQPNQNHARKEVGLLLSPPPNLSASLPTPSHSHSPNKKTNPHLPLSLSSQRSPRPRG